MRPISVMPATDFAVVHVGGYTLELETAEVDALVSALVDARTKLKPPFEWPHEPEPPWIVWHDIAARVVSPNPEDRPGVLFQIVHPAVGWTTYKIPRDLAQRIAEGIGKSLQEQA